MALIYIPRVALYNRRVTREIISAQLSILDGAWQEAPDNLAIFNADAGRGALYLVADVFGETEGRDELAREIIETARRAYAASRGPISLALSDAARAANDFFFQHNAALAPDARRIGGLVAAVVRDDDLFIAQAGPGVTCLLRDKQLSSFPPASIWFDAEQEDGNFPTPGACPLGKTRNYTPDIFHATLFPGDAVLVSTRALKKNLLTDEELVDTLADRYPDDIVMALEDIAGASDLSVIAIRVADDALPPPAPATETIHTAPPAAEAEPMRALEIEPAPIAARPPVKKIGAPTPEIAPSPRVPVSSTLMSIAAKSGQIVAGIFARVDWSAWSARLGRGMDSLGRATMAFLARALRVFLPGEPKPDAAGKNSAPSPDAQAGWRMAALVLPVILILVGASAWFVDRQDAQRRQAAQTAQWIDQANGGLENAKRLEKSDKNAARQAAQSALALADQARALSPTSLPARNAYFAAQDLLDTLNGISVVFLSSFATYADPKTSATRIVAQWPNVFVLDRGAEKVYRYVVDDVGSRAAPFGENAGVILKAGDKFADRTVADLIDLFWNDAGRLVALERSGIFLQYDLQTGKWTPRAASDAPKWKSATLASGYTGNLYLLDPLANQILKYVPGSDGGWSASTTYFQPGVSANLSDAADIAIDGDVWVLRANANVLRYVAGKPVDFAVRELDPPLVKPNALFTTAALSSLYLADAGNRRIVQIDKVSGKFQRQFRPSGQFGDAFNALQSLAVDETNRRFFIVSGRTAYLATIPQ
ncbi:MAG: hypothetical protein HY327_05770 [Chloroflexi bacterium]|nr:hypothetical protein [Chloroflexota bacterium]